MTPGPIRDALGWVLTTVLLLVVVVGPVVAAYSLGQHHGRQNAETACLARELVSLRADVADIEVRAAQVQARSEALQKIADQVARCLPPTR